jgi:putative ABC transport system permease protein
VFPSRRQPLPLENAELAKQDIANILAGEVGLPLQQVGIEVSSGGLMMQPSPESRLYNSRNNYLGNVNFTYIEGVAPKIAISEGQDMDADGKSGERIQVWVHDKLVQKMGLQLGEKLMVGVNLKDPNQIPVEVSGIWHADDPADIFWFGNPDATLADAFLVRRDDYLRFVQPLTGGASGEVAWYVILDDSKMIPSLSGHYLDGFESANTIINKFLPGTRMNNPPLDPLKNFVDRSRTMTVLLLAYNLPAFGILLYFLVLTSGTIAQWQRRETAMLVSRGMNAAGVLNLTLVEQLLLFVIGYPLGVGLGMLIAYLMGYTESFLTFTQREPLPVSLQGLSMQLTLLALGFSLVSRLWPAYRAARSSLVSEERERARPASKPFWFRIYLDIILLVPTLYAYDQLSKRGSLAGLVVDKPEDLYRDPLLILVPALFVVTLSLVTMRLFALVMRLIDLVAGKVPVLTLHLALRQLGRQSLDYVTPLLLVIISLALGVYTLSMAASLDQWLVDRMYYRAGADLVLQPLPLDVETAVTDGNWIPVPGDFMRLDGVTGATRVGDYSARFISANGREISGQFLAIDRADFATTGFFRPDFSGESLGALMNRLALSPEAILVPEEVLVESGLEIGDTITISVNVDRYLNLRLPFTISGVFTYFPTIYTEERISVVGNLDYLNSWLGYTAVHDLWLKTAPNTDTQALVDNLPSRLRIQALVVEDTPKNIAGEQSKMERVGIFGTLSIGFLATAVMAILSLLIYSYASLQERAYRFAVLHAVGLSRRQIMLQVIFEYAFLAMFGALVGAVIGVVTSQLFVPFFRFTGETGTPLPPLIPLIASGQLRNLSIAFAAAIVLAEIATVASTLQNRLAQMLKRAWL